MKVPAKLTILGRVDSFVWCETNGARYNEKGFYSAQYALAVNSTNTTLFFIPLAKSEVIEPAAGFDRQVDNFAMWAGFNAREFVKMNVPTRTLKKRGQVVRINYSSDKWTGNNAPYVHDFDDPAFLFTDRIKGPRVFGVKKPRGVIVTAEGII